MLEDYIVRVTWEQVDEYLNKIVETINPHNYTGVYGIPRGGLVLAAWLSHKLYLPLLLAPDSKCIIIDDICDSGDGLKNCLAYYDLKDNENCFISTMYIGKNALTNRINYYHSIKEDNWIAFPWER